MRSLLPTWMKDYSARSLSGDVIAALVVALVLVPQGLAYATLAGLPPQLGLYASLLPLIAYALLGSSMVLSVGPVAIASLMTAAALSSIAPAGSPEYIAAAVMLAMMSGTMLLLFGLLRLGALAQFLSHPVINGFITGCALLIILGQLRLLLGMTAEGDTAVALLITMAGSLHEVTPLSAAVGLGALILLGLARFGLTRLMTALGLSPTTASLATKLMPTVLVLGMIALVLVAGWEEKLEVVGELPAGLPSLVWPAFSLGLLNRLWLPALMIALIGFVASVAVAQSFAMRQGVRIDANAELRGLGAANIASALTGGFPVAGGFSRTAVNAEGGARTPLASIFAATLVALTLLFATELFRALPMAVLAATIIVAAVTLIDFKSLLHSWHYDRAEGVAQVGTALGVLITGVETGIAIGIGLSLATLVWRASRPHIVIVGRVPETEQFRNVERYQVETQRDLLLLRVDENLFFGNAEAVEKRILKALTEQPETRHLVLVMSSVSSIDATALEMLDLLNEQLSTRGIQLHLSEVKGPVLAQLEHDRFPERLSGQLHLSAYAAFEALRKGSIISP